MGSGHILVYAFDVFMEIYKECGYSERDAAASIVQNNLYGLDIDDRAYQLAYFAVMMKARSYNRRILTQGIWNNLSSIEETNDIESFEYDGLTFDSEMNEIGNYLLSAFKDAKEIGSLLTIKKSDYRRFAEYLLNIQEKGTNDIFAFSWIEEVLPKMLQITKQAAILSNKYTVVTTNPPYMGKMEGNLKQFVTKNYKDFSSDIFAVFMRRNFDFTIKGGYLGFMTPFVWMFIKSYEKLRQYIIQNKGISTLVQMEYSAYEEATVPICSFVLRNEKEYKLGYYYRLSDFKGGMEIQRQKVLEAQSNKECGYFYEAVESNFGKISGSPIAYWVSDNFIRAFENDLISDIAFSDGQILTGDNNKYLRNLWEVDATKVNTSDGWTLHAKGGEYRRWYGNIDTVVWWSPSAITHYKNDKIARFPKEHILFREGITWSLISSSDMFGMRLLTSDTTFNKAAAAILFNDNSKIPYTLGYLNSPVARKILSMLNPTLNTNIKDVLALPIVFDRNQEPDVTELVNDNVKISQSDWDAFETSWGFKKHPLIRPVLSVAEAYEQWENECENRFNRLKANEEELNRIFIDIYGLQDELNPDVEDKDITVRKADLSRDIRSLISYAVGCMFGRYSLDEDGLAYAGGEWDSNKYKVFIPDEDNIIPISDDEYFEDDIVGRFIDFVKVVYGEDTLEENLDFIASALGSKGTSREIIRNYFLYECYKDHCKMYQKRPIYWLFDSGKKNGFKALIYMHRYSSDLIARLRTQYVFEQQSRYRNQIEMLQSQLEGDLSSAERVKLNKQLKVLREQDEELRGYEEKVHHFADQMIDIDLDDGVKVNYDKFKILLAKIK